MKLFIWACALAFAFQVSPVAARLATSRTELRFDFAGRSQSVTLKELRAKLKTATFTVDDPVYQKKKTYQGFWLKDVLQLVGLGGGKDEELVFHCADGYAPTLPLEKLGEQKAMLAFREKGRKAGWEKLRQGKTELDPGPFYVVWDTQNPAFPWPYQVVGLETVSFKQKYNRIYPAGVERTSAVYRGFDRFRTSCIKCHSLNLQGGDLGPELNYPKNITEYWDEGVLTQFIKNPGQFRAKSKMPPFPDLKDQDLADLLEYLKWIREHKRGD